MEILFYRSGETIMARHGMIQQDNFSSVPDLSIPDLKDLSSENSSNAAQFTLTYSLKLDETSQASDYLAEDELVEDDLAEDESTEFECAEFENSELVTSELDSHEFGISSYVMAAIQSIAPLSYQYLYGAS